MARKPTKFSEKSASRVIELCAENKINQKQLSEITGLHQNTITKIVRGHSAMTDVVAQEIERAFPCYSAEYLKGNVDYKNESEHLDALINQHKEEHEKRIDLLKGIASLRGFEINLFYASSGPCVIAEDQYILRRGNARVTLSNSDVIDLLDQLCDFAELGFKRALRKGDE